ncbi:MAG: hypothetical protein J1E34_03175 [Oscillospiraceae bacterium]|nr:hypothetical protein [Oscillospiraceae bacterium]
MVEIQQKKLTEKIEGQLSAMRELAGSYNIINLSEGDMLKKSVNSYCDQMQELLRLLEETKSGSLKALDEIDDSIFLME